MGYERSLAPEKAAALGRNTHLDEMIGAWAGRQAEEELAYAANGQLVDRVWDVWEEGRKDGRKSEFVNLADPDLGDPVLRENWKMVPPAMRDQIRQKFGDDGFMVRRDMVKHISMRCHSASRCSFSEIESLRQALVECLHHHRNQTLTPADRSSQESPLRPSVQRRRTAKVCQEST